MGGASRRLNVEEIKTESAFLCVLCALQSASSGSGCFSMYMALTTAHLAGSCSSCSSLKQVKALHCWKFPVAFISLICSFYPAYTSVNSTFSKFSLDSPKVCLLSPAGSLTDRSITWDEKHKVPPKRTWGHMGDPIGYILLSPWQVCPGSVSAFARAMDVEF